MPPIWWTAMVFPPSLVFIPQNAVYIHVLASTKTCFSPLIYAIGGIMHCWRCQLITCLTGFSENQIQGGLPWVFPSERMFLLRHRRSLLSLFHAENIYILELPINKWWASKGYSQIPLSNSLTAFEYLGALLLSVMVFFCPDLTVPGRTRLYLVPDT